MEKEVLYWDAVRALYTQGADALLALYPDKTDEEQIELLDDYHCRINRLAYSAKDKQSMLEKPENKKNELQSSRTMLKKHEEVPLEQRVA